jgi:hypothetical protein
MSFSVRSASLLLCLASLLWSASLPAQSLSAPSQSDFPARAITLGKEGVALFEQERWAEALVRFREAEALFHSPVFVLYSARSLRMLGSLREARTILEKLSAEPVDASSPAPWQKAVADARIELDRIRSELPSVTLDVTGVHGSVELLLDGRAVRRGVALELDPGEHRASAVEGQRRADERFTLERGSRRQLTLRLPSIASPGRAVVTGAGAPKPAAQPSGRGAYLPGWIMGGTGLVALASGGAVGVLALKKRSKLRAELTTALSDSCDSSGCLSGDKADVDEYFAPARELALASDILWISGAVLTAGGIALIVIDPRPNRTATLSISPAGGTFRLRF